MKVLEDEKEMEVVEMIVHTEEEDLEMKQKQVEKAQKRFRISHLCNCDKICRWSLLKTVLRAIFAMSLVGGLYFTVKGCILIPLSSF